MNADGGSWFVWYGGWDMGTLDYQQPERMEQPSRGELFRYLAVAASAVVVLAVVCLCVFWGGWYRGLPLLFPILLIAGVFPISPVLMTAWVILKPNVWRRVEKRRQHRAWGVWMLAAWGSAVSYCLFFWPGGIGDWLMIFWLGQFVSGSVLSVVALRCLGPEVRAGVREFMGQRHLD